MCDDNAIPLCDTGRAIITVNAVNDEPVADPESYVINEDEVLNDDVSGNDSDPELDNLTYNTTLVASPTLGGVALLADGTFTYTPTANVNGSDSFIYEVCDDGAPSACDTALVSITINPVNDQPIAVNDLDTTSEDITLNDDFSTNDQEVDGENLVYTTTAVSGPSFGSVTINVSGTYAYIPNNDYSGNDTIFYEVCDDNAIPLCDTGRAIITINPVNDSPVALGDTFALVEDGVLTDDLSPNDTDPELDDLTYNTSAVAGPFNGGVAIAINGTFTYTPDGDFNGQDGFVYQVCDDGTPSMCDTAIVVINVSSVNDQPIAVNDLDTTSEDITLNDDFSTNDQEVDGENLVYTTTAVSGPSFGSVTINVSGTYAYIPNNDYSGNDTIFYEVCDDNAIPLCDTGRAIITVNAVNDEPVADPESYVINEDEVLNDDVSGNDSDPELDNLTYNTTLVASPTLGGVALLADGTFTYTPTANVNGSDSFIYEVCDDGAPSACDTALVSITINPVNDQPIAVNDLDTTSEDITLNDDFSTNDQEVDGENLVYTTTAVSGPSFGSVTINVSGTYAYIPNNDYSGNDTIFYEVCDDNAIPLCDTGRAIITVNAINDAPIAVVDSFDIDEDNILSNDLSANDSDTELDNLVYDTSAISGPSNGNVSINANGTFDYTPDLNFNGIDSFEYEVCDDGVPSMCDTGIVIVTIAPINDQPIAVVDSFPMDEDAILNDVLTGGDFDIDGDNLVYTTSAITAPASGLLNIDSNGDFQYTPLANFFGEITFDYEVCDDFVPALCDTATVIITVNNVNDSPDGVRDNYVINEDQGLAGDFSANDSDIDAIDLLTYQSSTVSGPTNGSVFINPTGAFTYSVAPNFNGVDTFIYRVCDNGTPSLCDTALVQVTVIAQPDAPIALDDFDTTDPGVMIIIDVQNNDSEVDGEQMTTSILIGPTNGTALLLNGDSIQYTPNDPSLVDFDTLTYVVCDPGMLCDTAQVVIKIREVPLAPNAVNDTVILNEDEIVFALPLDNDIELNSEDTLSLNAIIVSASNGLATIVNDSIQYVPSLDFNGLDSISYEVCDLTALCDTAWIRFEVTAVADKPNAINDSISTSPGFTQTINVQLNDINVDGDNLVTRIINGPQDGVASVVNNDSISYTANNPLTLAADTIEYEVCNGGGLCDTALVVVDFVITQFAPIAVVDSLIIDEEAQGHVRVLNNDSDPNLTDALFVDEITIQPNNGTASIVFDSILFVPNPDFFGFDSLTYRVCDNGVPQLCDSTQVYIVVNDVNDPPVIVNGFGAPADTLSAVLNENDFIEVNVNAVDVDGNALDVIGVVVNGSLNGVISDLGTGDTSFTFTPNSGYFGNDTLDVVVCDDGVPQLCDTVTVVLTTNSTNQSPIANDDATSTDPSTSSTFDVQNNDSDPDGDVLITSIIIDPKRGIANVVNSDSITYTSGVSFTSGSDTLTYTVCDPEGACDTAIFVIFVSPGELAPIASNDFVVVDEDLTTYFNVLDNDIDANGDQLLITSILAGSFNGVASILNDSIEYIPTTNFFGQDSLQYLVCDTTNPTPLCDTAWVFISVNNVNDAPIITESGLPVNQLSVSLNENDSVIVSIEASEIDGDAVDVSAILSGPTNGLISGLSDGDTAFQYVPNVDFYGFDTVSAVLCDDGAPILCDTVEVVFNVNSTNQSPTANDDFTNTKPSVDVTIDVQSNDFDPDGDTFTTSIVSGPSLGTATVINGDSITYSPGIAFTSGSDTLRYVICDPEAACDTAMVVIFVAAGQLAPIAANDSLLVNEGETAFADVLFNDVDPNGDSLTVVSISSAPNHGLFTIENNEIGYSASSDFNGLDSLSYVVCDTSSPSALCDTATLYINVLPVNDAPIFTDSLGTPIDSVFATTNQEEAVFVQFYGADIENDNLDVVGVVTGGLNAIISGLSDGDTALTFTPIAGFSGIEEIQVVMCDQGIPSQCDTVVLQVNVISALNNSPIAANDVAATDSGVAVIIDVQLNDIDPDGDEMTTTIVTSPINGTVLVLSGDSIEYTPNAGFALGSDTLTYSVCDAGLACDTATVVIFVPSGPLAPVAGNDFVTLDEDDSTDVLVLMNDSDPNGDSVFVSALVRLASNGNATITGDSIHYVPNEDYFGQDTISYAVCDTTSRCDTALVIFTISPINDAPEITDSLSADADTLRITTPQDISITVKVFATDIDSDTLSLTVVSGPTNGSIEGMLNDSLRFDYSPNVGYTGFDTIRYAVCDNGIPTLCDTAMLIIELFEVVVNNAPNAEPDFIATDPGVNVVIDVQANDTEPDGEEMSTTISIIPSNGVATVLNGDSISYTPNVGFDSGTDTLFYSVCDTNGACDTAMVVIFVPNSPYPPKGVDDYVTILEEQQVFIKVLFNDSDPNGDPITINSIITPPSNGQIISLGDSMRYTPAINFFGEDFYDYRVCDNLFLCDTARVYITVINVNDAPSILDSVGGDLDSLTFTTRMNIPVDITLLVQDYDPDVIEVTDILNGPSNGTVLGLGDGNTNFQFWPDTSFVGVDTFLVMVCDDGVPALCDSVNVIVNVVEGNNSAPIAEDDLVTADAGVEKTIDVQFNDSDPEGDFFITTIISGPSNGTAQVLNKDSISYTADSSFTIGVDTIQYTICDPGLLCDTAFLIIFVPDADLAPVVTGEIVVVLEDDSIDVAVLANDFDPNIDTIHVSEIAVNPVNGVAVLQNDTIKYIPNANFFGRDSLNYVVCDDIPLCDSAWLIFEVLPVDDAPVAVDDSASTKNSIAIEINVATNDIDLDGDVDLSLISIIDDASNGTVSVLESGVVLYTPFTGFIGADEFTYAYCDSISCDTATVFVTVRAFDGFFISEGVSPNGDGANDFLVIRGIENYPDNVVTILNRWGNVVYEQEGYNRFDETKVWKGLSNSGKELTDGTYYYIIKLNDGEGTVHTGFVLLSKTN